jgi:hypothetical protein
VSSKKGKQRSWCKQKKKTLITLITLIEDAKNSFHSCNSCHSRQKKRKAIADEVSVSLKKGKQRSWCKQKKENANFANFTN